MIEILKDLMNYNGVTQVDLCRAFGMSQVQMSKYIHGRIKPNIELACLVANYFNVSLDWLLQNEKQQILYKSC